jgi:Protein of unknown function (DUF1573)/Peptidase C39 family
MKRSSQWVAVCACVVIGAGAAGFGLRLFSAMTHSRLQFELASELGRFDPRYDEVMCGPVSLAIALARVGVSTLPADVAAQCKVTAQGVAMRDLERAANKTGLISASARRLNWDELSQLDGVAVLFVKENHYVAADPREVRQGVTKTAEVRIYESDIPAQWWGREKLEGIWAGEALVIRKQPARVDDGQTNARVAWDECYIDQGVLPRKTALAHYQFSFRNVGSSDLVIGEIQTSCGCIQHTLSKRRLAPGETSAIRVSVGLGGTEGYFGQYVYVNTNDPSSPVSILRMKGGVPRARVISTDIIRLEDLPQGAKVSKYVYVRDPGFNGAKIREARFVPQGTSGLGEQLSCLISHDLVGKDALRVASSSGFAPTRKDYALRLEFAASPACPLGPWQGEVNFVLDADGVVTTHKVALDGRIVQDVHPVPRLALITVDPKGAGRATIQLRSHSKHDFAVVKMWSDRPKSLKVGRAGEAAGAESKYTITAQVSSIVPGAAPLQRTAFFELKNGTVVTVPVALFRPPQK